MVYLFFALTGCADKDRDSSVLSLDEDKGKTTTDGLITLGAFHAVESISGQGTSSLWRYDPALDYKEVARAVERYVGVEFDAAAIKPKQGVYVSGKAYRWEEKNRLYINSAFLAEFGDTEPPKPRSKRRLYATSTDEEDAELGDFATLCEIERIRNTIKTPFVDGERNNHTMDLYFLCGKAGTDRDVLNDYVEANLTSHDFTMGEVLATCANRYDVGRNERIKELEAREARLDLDKYRVLTTDAIEPPTPVLSAPDGEIVGSEGNIILLLGKAKSKKTFLAQMMVAEFIQDSPEDVVIWVDTEQALSHTQKIAHRIKSLCDGELNEENFRLYALRELMPKDRAEFIERACNGIPIFVRTPS